MKISYQLLPIVLGFSIVGCNHNHDSVETENEVHHDDVVDIQHKEGFVSKLPESAPTVKVATIASGAPFVFKDEYGNVEGIDIDVMRSIGENQGFKVDFYTMPWEEVFDSVTSGNRDIAIAGISYKEDRDQKYGLSDSYMLNPSSIAYKNTNLTINGFDDLNGLKVGSIIGSKQLEKLKASRENSDNIYEGETEYLLFQQLIQDNVDTIIGDMPSLQYIAANHPDYDIKIVAYEDESTPEAQTVIVTDKQNTELLNKINAGIAKIKANGEMQAIEDKWLNNHAN